jgi:hypothetical protein
MSPIIPGVVASGISGHLTSGAWYSLLTTTVTSNVSSLTISGIPSGYKDLRIHIRGRDNRSDGGTISTDNMYFNGSSARTSSQELYGTGGSTGSVQTYAQQSEYGGQMERFSGGGAPAGRVGGFILDIRDYTSSKYKTWYYESVNAAGNTNQTTVHGDTWFDSSAITSISFFLGYSVTAITAPTVISIYGIKG